MTVNIPKEYISLARGMGIPSNVANDFYIRKVNQKPDAKDLVYKLSRTTHGTEAAARSALTKLWSEFSKLNFSVNPNSIDVKASAVVAPIQKINGSTYIEEARDALQRLIGNFEAPTTFSKKVIEKDRIVAGGDVHGVFSNDEAFARFCADPAEKAIIMGDFIDSLAVTRHRTTIDAVTMRAELADARAKLEHLSRSFKEVYYIRGNHDKRPLKRLQDIAPQLLPLLVDPLDLLTSDIPNIKRLSWGIPNTAPSIPFGENYSADFFGTLGDILVGHFETFMGPDAVKMAHKWLLDWEHILKLEVAPRVILQAHTHNLGMNFTPKGTLLINTGCLCRPMPYQFDQAGRYGAPVLGYVALYQKNGVTDLNKTEYICLQ